MNLTLLHTIISAASCPADYVQGSCVEGSVYSRLAVKSPEECCSLCDSEPQCVAWNLHQRVLGGLGCNLKNSSSGRVDASSCKASGFSATSQTPASAQATMASTTSQPHIKTPASAQVTVASTTSQPHIIFMLADDLGWYDTAVTGDQSWEAREASKNLVQLADDGMRLANHYVHWHCSPTRRTFLTGRTPLHHGEQLSKKNSDDIDVRWTWISEKLKSAGYIGHWYGKGHTGYKSTMHLPFNRGFDGGCTMFLGGAGHYTKLQLYNNTVPLERGISSNPTVYSTDLFGSLAVDAIQRHDVSKRLFLYLPWQAVHAPYDVPPSCAEPTNESCPNKIRAMVADVDGWVGKMVKALKDRDMYNQTLIIFTSDNGGVDDKEGEVGGNNYPLRGGKHTVWQGGVRTTTFVSGGFLPSHVRGTTHTGTFHIADWYPTLSALAGVDGSDDAPVPPLPVDESNPDQDIYQGNLSWPSVDGLNIWDELIGHGSTGRKFLWLAADAIIMDGRYKLVRAQPNKHISSAPTTGWRQPDGSWEDGGELDGPGCGVSFAQRHRNHYRPCLFDLENDEQERHDLAQEMPDLLAELWAELNRSELTAFISRSPPEVLLRWRPWQDHGHV